MSLNSRGNSPSCGVSTTRRSAAALIASNRRSGASAKLVSASASSTRSRFADSAVRTKSRARSPTPTPGPITHALRRLSVSISANSITVSIARTITAVSAAALTASASRGDASVTRPAPARSAPRADSRAAPVAATSPETTIAWPRAYLWPSIRGTGNDLRQNCGVFSKACGRISSSTRALMPISATRTRPQCIRPGSSRCAGLRRKNVTVSVARTAMPITAPVEPLTPLGRSTLRMGAPLALIASIISNGSPFTGRLSPAPNNASMISAGRPIACGLHGSTGYFHPRAADAASPCKLSRSHSRMTETSRPRAASSAAATNPSPPLLPRPATTRIGPSSTKSFAASATA